MDDRGRAIVEDLASGSSVEARRAQLRDEGILRVPLARARPAVEDGGLPGCQCEGKVAAQVVELRVPRREHSIRVQAGLPNGHDAVVAGPGLDLRPATVVD
ncbi:MAG: hypothetical protein MUP61_00155, partial [Burkholderiales bacterium]|nr:hypothetical protein [Burkholderiales bacterium]